MTDEEVVAKGPGVTLSQMDAVCAQVEVRRVPFSGSSLFWPRRDISSNVLTPAIPH